jgi:hypothetical protein
VAGRPRAGLVPAAAIGFGSCSVTVGRQWAQTSVASRANARSPGITPGLWGVALTWRTLRLVSAGTTVLVAGLWALDWLRGPTARTHLGAFLQRFLTVTRSHHSAQSDGCGSIPPPAHSDGWG